MTTTLLLLLSAALIVAGIALIWRDVRRGHRNAFLVRGDRPALAGSDPEFEVTVAHRDPASAAVALLADEVPPSAPVSTREAARQWAAIEPVLAAAVEQVNAVLAGAGVAVGASGEPSRSMNGGYGAYRRIAVGGDSVAWLRLELVADGQLQATVRAHKDDLAAINAGSRVAARGLDVTRASDLLSECLKPAASLAMRAAGGGSTDQWASEAGWRTLAPIVAAALQAGNGALAQTGARFVPIGAPVWVPETRRHRMTVGVEVFNNEVARMLIERAGEEIEVAVGLPDARLAGLGRRQRSAVQGLTTHALAELIVGCAWPAIAHFREAVGSS
jgi:hypothetical protein